MEHINNINLAILCLIFLILFFLLVPKKSYLKIEKQSLPNHKERSFFVALYKSSREHGYGGFFGPILFFVKRLRDHLYQVLSRIVPWSRLRVLLHKLRGVSIGKNVMIGPLVTIDDVYPNFVIIEEGVSLAGQNFILSHSKPLSFHSKLTDSYVAPTIIRKNVWVAIGVIVLPGVEIGEGSIIASGSVVTKDIPSNVMAGGTPAKVLKKFEMRDGMPIGFTND